MAVRCILLILVSFLAAALSRGETVQAPAKECFDIYLLMGQSNMVGRDTSGLAAQVDNPRVLALDAGGKWQVARDPIHEKVGRIDCGVGPGIPFALEMLRTSGPKRSIGLVPCAVGGTPLKRWVKGGDLYEKAVAKAKLAAQDGRLRGVLWHQGETDSEDLKSAETYEVRLTEMFRDLRADLGTPELPIVVGQLGEFLGSLPEKHPHVATVRAAIQRIPAVVPHTGFADSAGLGDKGDKLHFSAAAEKEFGARFARAMQTLQVVEGNAQAQGSDVFNVWPEGKMPGKGSRDPESRHSPERTDAIRITNVSQPTLTRFPAPGNQAAAPAMIVCPGGGYSYAVIDKEGTEIAAWLNSKGITAFVLKYRVPNNRGGALQDIQRALSLTRAKAGEWKIDPKRLGVIGFSAGGHLSARASTSFGERSYPPVDAVDQQSCRPDFAVLVYPAYLADKQGVVSADLNLKADIPPTLIVHSEDDASFIAGSKAYDKALEAAKKPHEFLLYRTGGHGYGLRSDREAKAWPEAAAEWLGKNGVR